MTCFLVLSTALPVRFGAPRQRQAYALRAALSAFGRVHFVTVDAWKTEWSSRHLRREGDVFLPHALERGKNARRGFTSWGSIDHLEKQGPATGLEPASGPSLASGWVSDARKTRLLKTVAAASADLVVVADPILKQLSSSVVPDSVPQLHLDTGAPNWLRYAAMRVRNADKSQWFLRLSAELAEQQVQMGAHNHSAYKDGNPTFALPIEQEQSDLFFEAAPEVLVPGTENAWLNELIVARTLDIAKQCPALSDADVRLRFFGLDRKWLEGAVPDAEYNNSWTRLHTAIGTARLLFMPVLTPELLPLVDAALSVGTPVLLDRLDVQHFKLASLRGVFAADETQMPARFAQLGLTPLLNRSYAKAIAEAYIKDAHAVASRQAVLAGILSEKLGVDVAPVAQTEEVIPPLARLPLTSRPRVLYSKATRMLMVRADLLGWGRLEELHILDGTGRELTRLAPNAKQQQLERYQLEGGLISDLAPLAGSVHIKGFCDTDLLFSFEIPEDEFEMIEAGFAALQLDKNLLSGKVWLQDDGANADWRIDTGHNKSRISEVDELSFPDLGLAVRSFQHALPDYLRAGVKLSFEKYNRDTHRTMDPPQSHLQLAPESLVTKRPNPVLETLKDRHIGQRGWIIGNGPSVRHEDLARIPNDDVVFCFNRFYLSYNDNPLREDYVVSADTLMIEDFGQEMIDLSTGLPLFLLATPLDDLSGDFVRLTPTSASVPIFSFDVESYVSTGGSSVFVALQMAWYMGLREVVLYGIDYSFSAKLVRDPRYPFPVSYDDGNHFIHAYRSAKPWCPPTWRDISSGFLNARIAFETTGGKIVNATRGGLLETFERADFDALCEDAPTAGAGRRASVAT